MRPLATDKVARLIAAAIFIIACFVVSPAQPRSATHAGGNWKQRRAATISYAKTYLVSKIEPRLPRHSFSRWFRKFVGSDARISWVIVDCGLQSDGSSERDGTMCVGADAAIGSDVGVSVYLQVGTFKDGIMRGRPIVRYARVSREDDPWQSTKSLIALSDVFDRVVSK